ncbi:RNA polymerase sigma factor [Malaciobacter sp. WC5094]
MLKYYNELVYYVQRMIGDKEQAVDIIQETYTKTIEKSKQLDIKNERAFLYKVAKNLVIDQSRKKINRDNISFEEENFSIPKEEQPEHLAIKHLEEELLIEALNSLPKRLKQVFVLHIFDGYSKKQIASMMDLNLNTVQKYVINATKKLSDYIEEKQ